MTSKGSIVIPTRTPEALSRVYVFISSTFLDMQTERDILTRRVFPRLRELFQSDLESIQEIDLRWGVTEVMSQQEGVLRFCFEEIERCLPFVLGMMGHRVGYRSKLQYLPQEQIEILGRHEENVGLTYLELLYASNYAQQLKLPGPMIFLRNPELSGSIHRSLDRGLASQAFPTGECAERQRKLIRRLPGATIAEYGSFDEFEEIVERGLSRQIKRFLSKNFSLIRPNSYLSTIDRQPEIQQVDKVVGRRSTLIFGEAGVGKSWLLRRWTNNRDSIFVIDGRVHTAEQFPQLLGYTDNVQLLQKSNLKYSLAIAIDRTNKGSIIAIDHFEEAFPTETAADLSLLPTGKKSLFPYCLSRLTGKKNLVVVSRSSRIRHQAERLGWNIVHVGSPGSQRVRQFTIHYLAEFGKHLDSDQLTNLLQAPWANRISSLLTALDELRRFGVMEALNDRINTLIECTDDASLGKCVLIELAKVFPEKWRPAISTALIQLTASQNGLDERLLRQAAGLADEPLPVPLWDALRLSLRSSFIRREHCIDLVEGPMVQFALETMETQPSLRTHALNQLQAVLLKEPKEAQQWYREMPGIALLRGGSRELLAFLSCIDHAVSIAAIGDGFIASWVDRLTLGQQQALVKNWLHALAELQAHPPDAAWHLGHLAAHLGQTEAAMALFRLDAERVPKRKMRDLAMVWLTRNPDAIAQLVDQCVNQISKASKKGSEIAVAVSIIVLAADGGARLSKYQMNALLRFLEQQGVMDGSLTQLAEIHLAAGQIELLATEWKKAQKHFTIAECAARKSSHARLLCSSLERCAAVALERNQFRFAKSAARECRDLARRLGLFHYEALAFERLIEAYQRRAEWTEAYTLVADYHNRCRETERDTSRPKALLDEMVNT